MTVYNLKIQIPTETPTNFTQYVENNTGETAVRIEKQHSERFCPFKRQLKIKVSQKNLFRRQVD